MDSKATFEISQEMLSDLQAEAAKNRMSMADLVRLALRTYMNSRTEGDTPVPLIK